MPRLALVTTLARTQEAFLVPVAKEMVSRGWTVHGLASSWSDAPEMRSVLASSHEVAWSRNPFTWKTVWSFMQAKRALAGIGPTLIYTHTPVASLVTRLAAGDVPVAYTAHGFHFGPGQPVWRSAVFGLMERSLARRTDLLTVMNSSDLAMVARWSRPDQVAYVEGVGLDLESFPFTPGAGRTSPQTVVVVGDLIARKRPELALRAFAAASVAGARLQFIGRGPLRSQLSDEAVRLGVSRDIAFLGHRTDVASLLADADALLHVALQEGLPRVVMEAMAVGTPVVATAARGTIDLVGADRGVLVASQDHRVVGEALGATLRRDNAAMVRVARQFVERLDAAVIAARYADHLERLVGEPTEASSRMRAPRA